MACKIRAEMDYEKNLNYIRYLNGLYSIRKITIYNEGDEPAKDLKLGLTFTPEFAQSWMRGLPEIGPGQKLEIVPTELSVDPAVMLDYNETLEGSINVEISGQEPLFKQAFPVTLLAYDIWYGGSHPELLASFVTPNDRKVLEIVANAGKKTGVAFTGYDATKEEIMHAIKAIFETIQDLKITYDYPPVNWQAGQRVRMPGFVVNNSVGCCIDMAVLFASCLEAIHLNPLIMLVDGHAVAGAWLRNATFEEAVEPSREKVEARSYNKLRELVMVECTLMENYASGDLFEYAVNSTDKLYRIFNEVIDVKRARMGGIRPIPLREIHDLYADGSYEEAEQEDSDDFYEEDDFLLLTGEDGQPQSKMDYWENKILDLSLRNSLVSMKQGTRVLPVMADLASICRLSNDLEKDRSFRLLPAPKEVAQIPKMGDMDGQQECIRTAADLIASDLQNARIRLLLGESDTASRLRSLHRNTENFIRETGTNVLYLAMGALRWHQEGQKTDKYAPILLIPVRLEKKKSDNDYALTPTSDEWQLNITLLEMLKEKYGIQVKLTGVPRTEDGIPYKALFNTIREAVKMKGFDVQERAFLGIFSFGQLMMWRDLHLNKENPDFTGQAFVASMIDGHLTWQPENVFSEPADLEAQSDPRDLLLPMSADGSQMAAIRAALNGESFVMHGPPGTGKSQTITDMIANLLADGKSVLFLTKKMAALEVVQQRLEEIGLGEFCLELHANKSSRQHVMNQFSRALALEKVRHDPLYSSQARKIKEKESELRSLIRDLHRRQSCGLSLYELMGMLEEYKDAPDVVDFDDMTIRMADEEDFASWKLQAASLQRHAKKLEGLSAGLRGIKKAGFGRNEKDAFLRAIENTLELREELGSAVAEMEKVIGAPEGALAGSRETVTAADILAHIRVYPKELASLVKKEGSAAAGEAKILAAFEAEGKLHEELTAMTDQYDRAVLEEDLEGIRANVQAAGRMLYGGGKVIQTAVRILQGYAADKESITEKNILSELDRLIRLEEKTADREGSSGIMQALAGGGISRQECGKLFDRRRLVEDRINRLDMGPVTWNRIMDYARERTLGLKGRYERDLPVFQEVSACYDKLKDRIGSLLDMSGKEYAGEASDLIFDASWYDEIRGWKESFFEIDSWCSWLTESEQARAGGLDPLVTAMEQGLSPDDVEGAFYKGFARSCIRYITANNRRLQYFSGSNYELTADQYRSLCEQFEEMTRKEIRARLIDRIPDLREGSDLKDLALLQKAVRGSGDHLTIRELFNKMPEAVRLLAPCMLMSPASVAQYIDVDFPKFDVVIIDEASQLPTCEAVGAIARGKSLVIAGDEHQLPPTRFFQKKKKGEAIEITDLESILEDALALNMPQCYLNWHYRSAHESLITFSNLRYYGGRLRTFPSVDDRISAVHFENAGGIYDRSGSRTNPAEADALIAAMRERILSGSGDSIGVITFNIQQCRLIEDKWEKLLAQDQELEQAAAKLPPVLIKNLESIQGDERDVIYFSIGFGPDAQGNMSQNFGPVNQKGGQRRLNVAITRARKEMHIFASFDPSSLRVTPASPAGVRDLADFLRYAKEGTAALAGQAVCSDKERERVSRQIASRLQEEGYEVDAQVGSSGFVIDAAVRDPRDPDRYLLGILLDDSKEAMKDTVRDRCILQKNVLRRMDWNLCNVWMLDWFDSPDTQIYKIKQVIGRLIRA